MEWSDETHFGVEDNSNPPTKYATPSLLLLFHSHADPAKCVVLRWVVDFAAPETKLPERTLWASAEKLRSSHCAPQHLTRPSPCVPSLHPSFHTSASLPSPLSLPHPSPDNCPCNNSPRHLAKSTASRSSPGACQVRTFRNHWTFVNCTEGVLRNMTADWGKVLVPVC